MEAYLKRQLEKALIVGQNLLTLAKESDDKEAVKKCEHELGKLRYDWIELTGDLPGSGELNDFFAEIDEIARMEKKDDNEKRQVRDL